MSKAQAELGQWGYQKADADVANLEDFVDTLRRHHRGRANAISAREFAERYDCSASRVRDYREAAVETCRLPIVSLGNGYFVPDDRAELELAIDRIQDVIATKRRRWEALVDASEHGAESDKPDVRGGWA